MVRYHTILNHLKVKRCGSIYSGGGHEYSFQSSLATVDGNVFRVWSRLNNDYRDIKLQSTRKAFEQNYTRMC